MTLTPELQSPLVPVWLTANSYRRFRFHLRLGVRGLVRVGVPQVRIRGGLAARLFLFNSDKEGVE
jgi:hypothetical protein